VLAEKEICMLDKNKLCDKYYYFVEKIAKTYFKSYCIRYEEELISNGNEVFLYILNNLGKFNITTEIQFVKYIRKMVKLRMINYVDYLHRKGRDRNISLDQYNDTNMAFAALNWTEPFNDIENKIMVKKLFDCSKLITDRQKEVLRLCYGIDDGIVKTIQEVADILNIHNATVHLIKQRGLEALRRTYCSIT
jgi:RNA polymerase sigma factor (sigma-70 family)